MKPDLLSLSPEQLTEVMSTLGQPKFRAKQIYEWLHKKLVRTFDAMTNLPTSLRQVLEERYICSPVELVTYQESQIDGTRKYLFSLPDGNVIESVWMQYHHGNSVCISSQVGCRMGCRFCASTMDGLVRGLTPGEMLGQIYEIARHTEARVSNVVIMGSGEPLDNFDAVVAFLHHVSDERGYCISQRSITLSTCGLVPQIYQLAEQNLQITLAISLHAAEDAVRQELMPVAKAYSLKELLEACDAYFAKTGRRMTFEYSLVQGVNDNEEQALILARLLKGRNCHVNLIPVNPVKERDFKQPLPATVLEFKKTLEKNGINATIRREMGRDIDGACGQLRKRFMEGQF